MEIGLLLNRIRNGETIANIAKDIDGIGEKRLRQALKSSGYEFKNSGEKGWHYIGEGQEPLDKSIFDYAIGEQKVIKSNNKVIKEVIESNNDVITGNNFTLEEIHILKKMANNFITNGNNEVIKQKIKSIENVDRKRKTFHFSEVLSNRLSNLADKNDISKSDLLELAVLELLERYE